MGSRGQPEESRAAILEAAAQEFSEHGIDGARTDEIARHAGVNKALLYYYFRDKETLYGEVLNSVFSGLRSAISKALDSDLPPREKVLAYAGAHFDYVAVHPLYPRLIQREMMRAPHHSAQAEKVIRNYLVPTFNRIGEMVADGIAKRDFRRVDPVQFVPSMVAIIVFYFTGVSMMQRVTGLNPLTPERIAERRAAVLDFISAALFAPKNNGTQGAR